VEDGSVAVMDPGTVLEAQAQRTLDEIEKLQAELDGGPLVVEGSMKQPVATRLLGELRQHRLLLLRLLGVSAFGGEPSAGPDELDRIRSEWESGSALPS
jgi:hypothetical protein